MDWCRQWLKRASELEAAERVDRSKRAEHAQHSTDKKRLLLTEILESIQYEDKDVTKFLREGATLAGEIERCKIFEDQFKPCLLTLDQLEAGASKRNQAILAMTTTSGDEQLDMQLLGETLDRGA